MYNEKMKPILEDLENKEIDVAGGGVVGIVLSTINSLITYISNLTIGKKNYEENQEKVLEIKNKAQELKIKALEAIDRDKEMLEEILLAYKIRKDNPEKYQEVCKKATEFCLEVVYIADNTLKLSEEISKVGNKMLASDFKICKYYSIASIWSAVEDVYINVKTIEDQEYKAEVENKCNKILANIKLEV